MDIWLHYAFLNIRDKSG
uniref:Uncharacterized protein n=1 Tax=Anguilla anguilla TaxID=7936 RepID=A0A0E9V252_ANGAN